LVEIFDGIGKVDVIATSKGKGFQGVMRPTTSGRRGKPRIDVPPGAGFDRLVRVSLTRFKGMRAAGHMGSDRVTVKNLKVIRNRQG